MRRKKANQAAHSRLRRRASPADVLPHSLKKNSSATPECWREETRTRLLLSSRDRKPSWYRAQLALVGHWVGFNVRTPTY
jgi:hypothetical protein